MSEQAQIHDKCLKQAMLQIKPANSTALLALVPPIRGIRRPAVLSSLLRLGMVITTEVITIYLLQVRHLSLRQVGITILLIALPELQEGTTKEPWLD